MYLLLSASIITRICQNWKANLKLSARIRYLKIKKAVMLVFFVTQYLTVKKPYKIILGKFPINRYEIIYSKLWVLLWSSFCRKHANKEIDLKGRTLGPEGELKQTTKNGIYIRGSGSQVNTKIKCDVCGEEFNCNTRAIQHKFRKHPFDAVKHYCPQCGMQFPLQVIMFSFF